MSQNKRQPAITLFAFLLFGLGTFGVIAQFLLLTFPIKSAELCKLLYGSGADGYMFHPIVLMVGILFSSFILFGAISMYALRRFNTCVIVYFLAMVPLAPWNLILVGFPIGFGALVSILAHRRAFEARLDPQP